MKKSSIMKKIGLMLLVGILVLSVVACSQNKPTVEESPLAKESLSTIFDKIYEGAALETAGLAQTDITVENIEYYLGTSDIEFTEGMASEPMIGSSAHSMVLIRVEDGSDIEKIMSDIKTNVDPRKWICVGVETENVIVDNVDNMIILIMDEQSDVFHEAFLALIQ